MPSPAECGSVKPVQTGLIPHIWHVWTRLLIYCSASSSTPAYENCMFLRHEAAAASRPWQGAGRGGWITQTQMERGDALFRQGTVSLRGRQGSSSVMRLNSQIQNESHADHWEKRPKLLFHFSALKKINKKNIHIWFSHKSLQKSRYILIMKMHSKKNKIPFIHRWKFFLIQWTFDAKVSSVAHSNT